MTQISSALSHEALLGTIPANGGIATQWPFEHAADPERFRPVYTDYINPGNGTARTIVIGQPYRLGTDRTSVAINYDPIPGVSNPNTDLHVLLDPDSERAAPKIAAWQQLLGVRMAMEVQTVRTRFSAGMRRYVTPLSILGIEQPYIPGVSEEREPGTEGYVQGLVVGRTEAGPRQHALCIDLGQQALSTQVFCSQSNMRAVTGIEGPTLPEAGDRIRARVTIPEAGQDMTVGVQGSVYILGR
jgi:hypothetical protein